MQNRKHRFITITIRNYAKIDQFGCSNRFQRSFLVLDSMTFRKIPHLQRLQLFFLKVEVWKCQSPVYTRLHSNPISFSLFLNIFQRAGKNEKKPLLAQYKP